MRSNELAIFSVILTAVILLGTAHFDWQLYSVVPMPISSGGGDSSTTFSTSFTGGQPASGTKSCTLAGYDFCWQSWYGTASARLSIRYSSNLTYDGWLKEYSFEYNCEGNVFDTFTGIKTGDARLGSCNSLSCPAIRVSNSGKYVVTQAPKDSSPSVSFYCLGMSSSGEWAWAGWYFSADNNKVVSCARPDIGCAIGESCIQDTTGILGCGIASVIVNQTYPAINQTNPITGNVTQSFDYRILVIIGLIGMIFIASKKKLI